VSRPAGQLARRHGQRGRRARAAYLLEAAPDAAQRDHDSEREGIAHRDAKSRRVPRRVEHLSEELLRSLLAFRRHWQTALVRVLAPRRRRGRPLPRPPSRRASRSWCARAACLMMPWLSVLCIGGGVPHMSLPSMVVRIRSTTRHDERHVDRHRTRATPDVPDMTNTIVIPAIALSRPGKVQPMPSTS